MSRNRSKGIWLMVAAVFCFALQDGFSRHLAETYNTLMVIMVRYWVFAAFVLVLALRRPEGFRAAIRTKRPVVHALRGTLLVAEVCLIVWGYTMIGLIESHAVFAVCPLLIAALSGPILGEKIGWQRWAAIGAGLVGVLVVLRPTSGVFSWPALLPFAAALMFATYSILTRLSARDEAVFPSFFWSAIIGAGFMTLLGLPNWQAVQGVDLGYLAVYCALAILSHWLLTICYENAEANVVQPYAYLQIVFVTVIGMLVYGERLAPMVALGTVIVVAAGIFALTQERRRA
ncbi:EamA family transporter [Gemmobacter aquarius]|uniref:EamA family transporter n=1 Tax=Paragemmobacter aquarius TaxID=2169400 RepID=A0A2S0UNT0_9RHOB|nr:DMT family transporter [Gemmobacter aquarius]AWB49474.1 EamA family transporter [Gemmobacter aquarius]